MLGSPGMPTTAVTRPPPTEGPRLRNLRLLRESAPTVAGASGAVAAGRAAGFARPRPCAATAGTRATARSPPSKPACRRAMGRIALTPSKDLEGTDQQRLDLRVRPRRVKRAESSGGPQAGGP